MTTLYFIAHPEVVPDPGIPISMWNYTDYGMARWEKILTKLWIKEIEKIYTSPEARAIQAAQGLSHSLGYSLHTREDLGPIKKPDQGKVVAPEEYAASLGQFYQFPSTSVTGWETASEAQKRIVTATSSILQESQNVAYIAVISHEDLGNLLLSHVKQVEIQQFDTWGVGTAFQYENGACVNWQKLEL